VGFIFVSTGIARRAGYLRDAARGRTMKGLFSTNFSLIVGGAAINATLYSEA
jgi:hypothetical protein